MLKSDTSWRVQAIQKQTVSSWSGEEEVFAQIPGISLKSTLPF